MINEACQYMTFKLGDELYAINVSQVREVLDVLQITKVPTAPAYMRGVVNVRGQAIPALPSPRCKRARWISLQNRSWEPGSFSKSRG